MLRLKKVSFILSFILITVLLLSCGEKIGGPYFPAVPDKIVIGISGVESTVVPGDEAFDEIVSRVRKLVEMSGGLDTAKLYAEDPETGKHLSYDVRESEIFVEFIYNAPAEQTFIMNEGYGKTYKKAIDVARVFIPLGGNDKDLVFIGCDAKYENHTTLGELDSGESFASYIAGLLAPVD